MNKSDNIEIINSLNNIITIDVYLHASYWKITKLLIGIKLVRIDIWSPLIGVPDGSHTVETCIKLERLQNCAATIICLLVYYLIFLLLCQPIGCVS